MTAQGAWELARRWGDMVLLGLLLLAVPVYFSEAPPGVYGIGIVSGSGLALHAIGIVLVYRSNRIINFAQVQIGIVAATLFTTLVQYAPLLRGLRSVCPPCLDTPSAGLLRANYWVSLGLSFLVAVLLSYGVYYLFVKRFSNAPRLTLTVATLFVAQLLGAIGASLPRMLLTEAERRIGFTGEPIAAPFDIAFTWEPVRFVTGDILLALAGVISVVGLTIYLRKSPSGVAIRASAENASRMQTLGVDVDRMTAKVWVISGLLSAVAGLLGAMRLGVEAEPSLTAELLVMILAVAVIARMTSLPKTILAAVVLGIVEQAMVWVQGSSRLLVGTLVVIIGAILLVQRTSVSRAEFEQASGWRAEREIRPTPSQLRGLPTVKAWYRGLAVVGILLALGLPWALSPQQTSLASLHMIFGMVALSLVILSGWAGQISLGQFGFAAVGGYVLGTLELPLILELPLAAIAGAIVAGLLGIPAIKMRGLQLAVMTLAFAVAVPRVLMPRLARLTGGLPDRLERPSLLGMSFADDRVFYYFTLLMLMLVVVIVVGLRRSRVGRSLVAARDNARAAESFGIAVVRARLTASMFSGGIAAFAGALYAMHQNGVRAGDFVEQQSINVFLMAVLGGFGHWVGPLLGALYTFIVALFSTEPIVQMLSVGGLGIVILLTMPGGLVDLVFGGIRDNALRRVARRNRIIVPSLVADTSRAATSERAEVIPKEQMDPGSFVPVRYRLDTQWILGVTKETVAAAASGHPPKAEDDDAPAGSFGAAGSGEGQAAAAAQGVSGG